MNNCSLCLVGGSLNPHLNDGSVGIRVYHF